MSGCAHDARWLGGVCLPQTEHMTTWGLGQCSCFTYFLSQKASDNQSINQSISRSNPNTPTTPHRQSPSVFCTRHPHEDRRG